MNNYLIKYINICIPPKQPLYYISTKLMDNEDRTKEEVDNYRMYKILLQLLQARGFTIGEDKQNLSFDQFQNRRNDLEEDLFFKEDDEAELIMAVKCNFNKRKINSELIQDFMKNMLSSTKLNPTHFFIVAATDKKNSAMAVEKSAQTFEKTKEGEIRIQFFHDENLKFNLLKHDLVPEHLLLKKKEEDDLLDYYKVKRSQLPKILHSDPVAKFLGLRRNQIVKIIRKSETAGVYTTYRTVV